MRHKQSWNHERDGVVERLREFLRFNYMTGAQAAQRIGVRPETLYSWLQGTSRPRSAQRIIALLNSMARMNRKQARFPEIYRALGELAIEATKLESELTITLCQLITGPIKDPKSINVGVVNAIASEKRSFPQLANFVQKIFNAYVMDKDARKALHSSLGVFTTLASHIS